MLFRSLVGYDVNGFVDDLTKTPEQLAAEVDPGAEKEKSGDELPAVSSKGGKYIVTDKNGNELPDYDGFAKSAISNSPQLTFIYKGARLSEDSLLVSSENRNNFEAGKAEIIAKLEVEDNLMGDFMKSSPSPSLEWKISESSMNSNSVSVAPKSFGGVFANGDLDEFRKWLEPFKFGVHSETDKMGVFNVIAPDRDWAQAFVNRTNELDNPVPIP